VFCVCVGSPADTCTVESRDLLSVSCHVLSLNCSALASENSERTVNNKLWKKA